MLGLDNSDGGGSGEFKRSASARLHRNKKNYPEMLNQSEQQQQHQHHGLEDSKKKEQVRDESSVAIVWLLVSGVIYVLLSIA